jgi:hypothetical protein
MCFTTRVGLLAGATALTLTGVSYGGPATESTDQDMAQRLAAAEAKIAAMEAAQNQTWLSEARATEIRGLVQDVLADADTRASLLQGGGTAGYDHGFVISDPSGNWLLRTNFLMQQRFIWNMRDDDGAVGVIDANRYGFENTRSKFMLSGHVVNPDWYYRVDNNLSNNGSDRTGMLNAYLGHNYGNGWKIQMGAMKLPILREELVESQYQLAVERSVLNYIYTGGYADGIMAIKSSDQWQFMAMFSDGINSGNTVWNTYDTEYALTGRLEWKASGTWDQFKDFTSAPGDASGILLGAAVHYQDGEYGTPATETQVTILTGDVQVEMGRFNGFAEIVWNDINSNAAGTSSINPFGFLVQGGFYLNDCWELYGRYEWSDFDISGADDLNIITAGVNYYFSGHNAKWTTDIGYSLDSLAFPNPITGFLPDAAGNDGQVVIRTQWQILF